MREIKKKNRPGRKIARRSRNRIATIAELGIISYSYGILKEGKMLKALINKPKPVILEIGCNDGLDTKTMLDLFPDGEIHCFEPEPRAIKRFLETVPCVKNGGNDRCFLHEVAIGKEDGECTFYQSSGHPKKELVQDWDLSGSLNLPTGHKTYSPSIKFENEITVPVRRLDDYIQSNFKKIPTEIDLIWMDIQGGEKNAILGGMETFAKARYLYTEFGHLDYALYDGQMSLRETVGILTSKWKPLGIYEHCNLFAIKVE